MDAKRESIPRRTGIVRRVFTGGAGLVNRPGVFYVIVVALTIVLGMIGLALYACGIP